MIVHGFCSGFFFTLIQHFICRASVKHVHWKKSSKVRHVCEERRRCNTEFEAFMTLINSVYTVAICYMLINPR